MNAQRSEYLVVAPHTVEECAAAIEKTDTLNEVDKWRWGCGAGNHTGYLFTEADSEGDALRHAPESPKARAFKLNRYTREEVRAAHPVEQMEVPRTAEPRPESR